MKHNKNIYILGIESSCDDTSAAVTHNNKVISNIVSSQKIHQKFGGVVPELASRNHQCNITLVVSQALKQVNISLNQLHGIAFTRGPGLLGSLLVGTSFAKSLSLSLNVPLIEVNHMKAHVIANFINNNQINFPLLCLTVSGGHTQIVLVKNIYEMEIIGETVDDSAGEAFDKTAKMLGLSYPGGPIIEKMAELSNKEDKFSFPEPKISGLKFSFSGLKTNISMFIQNGQKNDSNFVKNNIHEICYSIQKRIVSILINKLIIAIKETEVKNIAIAGGVASNKFFRKEVKNLEKKFKIRSFSPEIQYSTDNAAMIALTGYFKYLKRDFSKLDIEPTARYKF